MHATNNHSDIIFSLRFLLMRFLSGALMVRGKPDSAKLHYRLTGVVSISFMCSVNHIFSNQFSFKGI